MNILTLGFIILTVVGTLNCYQKCLVDFKWKPFNGKVPDGAFVGGLDANGNATYIAKIVVVNDGTMWTVPAQLYKDQDYIDVAWYGSNNIMRINKFINILVPNKNSTLKWVDVKNGGLLKYNLQTIEEKCCIVEGGIGVRAGHVYVSYIGKIIPDGKTSYIGRLYRDNWEGLHLMYGRNSTKRLDDIKVLTYGCKNSDNVSITTPISKPTKDSNDVPATITSSKLAKK